MFQETHELRKLKLQQVSKGYEYRVVSTVKTYKGSKSESKTMTSNIEKY